MFCQILCGGCSDREETAGKFKIIMNWNDMFEA